MGINIEVNSITCVVGQGADHLILTTNLPEGCWPFKGNTTVGLTVAHGDGVEYCYKHFNGVPLRIVKDKE